ncbi:hypothetical protein ACJMK2_014534 [Sinanodonta woodiana]|uniref:lysoplasmalogenase n=1 Tax=Sinanodonta woodiana TaxID=1069815 RepID=A0ABD3V3S9_SINWO
MNDKLYLVMFVVSTIFLVWHYDLYDKNLPETLNVALMKALPIVSLVSYVSVANVERIQRNEHKHLLFVFAGLLISSLGDMCLTFPHSLFMTGMLLFAMTHCCYAVAFGKHTGGIMTKIVFLLMWISGFMLIQSEVPCFIMKVLILGYSAAFCNTGWRSTARFESERTIGAFIGCLGTILFMSSDFIIAINKWVLPIPKCEFISLVTYYCGQLGIVLGTMQIHNDQ